ncbi:MAG: hypothetical protein CMJ78_26805 [Planctomycetaceae bacterium]|nr:hypothetical protein [Planctomycetaceae bacterium]
MGWVVYFIASGQIFFLGGVLFIVTVFTRLAPIARLKRYSPLLMLVGFLFSAISGTPISLPFVLAIGVATASLFIVERRDSKQQTRATAWTLITLVVSAMLWEARYHVMPKLGQRQSEIVLFADSLSAGIDQERTWPKILSDDHDVTVHDYSRAGAKLSTALAIAEDVEIPAGLILLEIGGNDILGSTSPQQFHDDMKALMAHLRKTVPTRPIVMFELPLLPFYNSYGSSQRQLAREYNVKLLPKRILMGVLSSQDATLDSIHLSPTGHREMARIVWALLNQN